MGKTMLRWTMAVMLALALLLPPMVETAAAKDAQYKYIIPTMKTQADADKIKAFIKARQGVREVDVYLDRAAVVVLFDNAVLDNEKIQLRVPLKKEAGYPVETVDILFETQKDEI